nr:hypothetical protein [Candidatus Sigynarchaeota archaeon]
MVNVKDREQIGANKRLLTREWIDEIDVGVKHMVPIIKQVFRPEGFLGLLVDPFIDMAAVAFLKSSRKTGLKQMDITTGCAMQTIETGLLDAVIEQHAPRFAELDEMVVYGRKRHPRFPDIKKSIGEEFAMRVQETVMLLGARPPDGKAIESVGDIYKIAYNNDKDRASSMQDKEIACIEYRVQLVTDNDGLVDIPFGMKDRVLKVVREGITYTRARYVQNIDRYFS